MYVCNLHPSSVILFFYTLIIGLLGRGYLIIKSFSPKTFSGANLGPCHLDNKRRTKKFASSFPIFIFIFLPSWRRYTPILIIRLAEHREKWSFFYMYILVLFFPSNTHRFPITNYYNIYVVRHDFWSSFYKSFTNSHFSVTTANYIHILHFQQI